MPTTKPGSAVRILRFISQMMKSLWLFFPGILFLLFTICCFWILGQGKDIVVAFTENRSRTSLGMNYTRVIFFMAIAFWVYVTWYSSRVIAYIKKSKQEDAIQKISGLEQEAADKLFLDQPESFDLSNSFLDAIPRTLGNACFIILELAVLQSPILTHPLNFKIAFGILVIGLLIMGMINKWILTTQAPKPAFRRTFWILLYLLIALVIIASFFTKISILSLFFLLLLFHVVFVCYINLRRMDMEKKAAIVKVVADNENKASRNLTLRVMDSLCIPRKESGFFNYFIGIGLLGVLCYLATIFSLTFARNIGPFPFIILAFGVLLAFGNSITAVSIRYKVNLHFLLFLLALILGLGETHYVRTKIVEGGDNKYMNRPDLKTYLAAWINERKASIDSANGKYAVYFVMSNGGASRSGYWTAGVLGRIEDASLAINPSHRFSDHIFCLSGTSGGGVGVAAFFSLLRDKEHRLKPYYDSSARDYLSKDYFTYTFARMLGPDYFNYIFHFSSVADRAAALEMSFERSTQSVDTPYYQLPFNEPFSNFPAMRNGKTYLPILCVNTTRMQDGNPGLVTNLNISGDTGIFNQRVDVVNLLTKDQDISITSAAILGARFPYLSPAGRIGNNYFVDGGYFDNSGAGVVQEMMRGIMNYANDDSLHGGILYKEIRKLHFKILHIINSPVDQASMQFNRVAPMKNDLLAPILTIIGAYNMQTTVNDGRLVNYISDMDKYYQPNGADYTQVSLYKDSTEFSKDPLFLTGRFKTDPAYAMNWFMSDTTRRRINSRLDSSQELSNVIHQVTGKRN